jgi:hypothetical protein
MVKLCAATECEHRWVLEQPEFIWGHSAARGGEVLHRPKRFTVITPTQFPDDDSSWHDTAA